MNTNNSSSTSLLPPNKKKPVYTRHIHVGTCLMVIGVIGLVVIWITLFNVVSSSGGKQKKPVSDTLGGIAVDRAQLLIIDIDDIVTLRNTMQQITSACSPVTTPSPDPIYSILQIGTAASTTASWHLLRVHMEPVCHFYGLDAAETRVGGASGPVDICYAYVSVTLQIVELYYKRAIPTDFLGHLITGVGIAYPLNLYWATSPFSNYDVAANLLGHITQYISSGDRTVSTYASAFCNPYFASSSGPASYSPLFAPHLAFPFSRILTRTTQTAMTIATINTLGQLTTATEDDFKHVYVIGDVLSTFDGADLFIQTMIAGVPTTVLDMPLDESIATIRTAVANSNISALPVLVMARYSQDYAYFNSLTVDPGTIVFGFTNEDPDKILPFDIATVIQNARAINYMNVFDFTTDHPYEESLGPNYVAEKDVADLINAITGTWVNPNTIGFGGLLDTFAMKNTMLVVPDIDLGGRMTRAKSQAELVANGVAAGLHHHGYSMTLTESVHNQTAEDEANNNDIVGGGAPAEPPPLKYNFVSSHPACGTPVVNQKSCNNCWAIASADSMTMRACSLLGVSVDRGYSTQHVTSCAQLSNGNNGCNPQYPNTFYTFANGDVHTRKCMAHIDTTATELGCQSACNAGSGASLSDVNGIQAGSYKRYDKWPDIRRELVTNGPLAVAISIPSDFLSVFPVTGGGGTTIYRCKFGKAGSALGGHFVTLIGYDETDPNPSNHYVEIKNSWGSSQGLNGVIRFMINDPNCADVSFWFDRYAYAALPRMGSANPITVLTQQASSPSTAPSPMAPVQLQTKTYTNPYGCPSQILNKAQTAASSATAGCANSASSIVAPAPVTLPTRVPAPSNDAPFPYSVSWYLLFISNILILMFVA